MKKLALDMVAILSSAPSEGGTPIDTGWASANWIPSVGAPVTATAGTRPDNATHGANNASRTAQQQGIANVATKFDYYRDGTIHVSNAVPYIIELNEGNSSQAGPGFVQRGMHRVVRNFRKTLRTEVF